VLTDPDDPSAQLAVRCYVIPVPSKSQTVYAVFFAAENQLNWKQDVLDVVARSIERGK
jgi:hypothetical protein